MSDTPRTDSEIVKTLGKSVQHALSETREFAKKLERENIKLRAAMEAAASMAGKHWLICQLALGEALDGNYRGKHLVWVLSEHARLSEESANAD
jgi:hypothetical protein